MGRAKTITDMKEYRRQRAAEWRKKHPGYSPNQDASIVRACFTCKKEMPYTVEFFAKEKTRPLGLTSDCKKCQSIRRAAYAKAHRDQVNARQRIYRKDRERGFTLRKYGLTPEQYDAILNAQGGVCAICSTPPSARDKHRLHVDHDHTTKRKHRGLLCMRCNQSIERIENDPEWGVKALNYLARFIEQTVTVQVDHNFVVDKPKAYLKIYGLSVPEE